MFKRKKKKEPTSLDEIEVKLKKIGNVRPGVYLSFIYAFVLILIVFFVFFLPGIVNPGSRVNITSLPESAAVYIDGKYAGTSPCEVFIAKGIHTIVLDKEGFQKITDEMKVPGRLFASLPFPKEIAYTRRLPMKSPEKLLESGLTDFAGWASIDSFHYRYQPQMRLSETLETIHYGKYPISDDVMEDFFLTAFPHVGDEALLKDFIRARILSITRGRALSPATLVKTLEVFLSAQEKYPKIPFWLGAQLSSDTVEEISTSRWYESTRTKYMETLQAHPGPAASAGLEDSQVITIEGLDFVFIPEGNYKLGGTGQESFPLLYTSPSYYIAGREVTYRQFSRFLAENPRFHPSNKDELIEDGLVTEEYLQDWNMNSDTDLPLANVSYHVAKEFCRWLETKLPDFASEDFSIDLPDEYQWETAALFSDLDNAVLHDESRVGPREVSPDSDALLSDFYGNLWEWCDNWYAQLDFVLFDENGIRRGPSSEFPGIEKSVRGGSWAVMEDLVSVSSRGGQPPEWCTPFLGFRPAILPK